MKYYFKVDENDIIQDVITFAHEGYKEVDTEKDELPVGINAGYYKLNGNTLEIVSELKESIEKAANPESADIQQLKTEVALMQAALDDLIFGGGL